MKPSTYSSIYTFVKKIPKGRVATYGQIAKLAGIGRQARRVGYALSALPEGKGVPWHRVVNAQGEISRRAVPGCEDKQRELLENEGVDFDIEGRIALSRFQWRTERS